GAGEIELTVGESDPDSGPRLSLNAAEGIDYRWSLAVPFTARRVPTESGTGAFVPQTYQIGGTNDRVRGLIEVLLDQVDNGGGLEPKFENLSILYPPAQGSGLDSGNPSQVLLVKTNLSTESAPPTALAATAGQAEEGDRFSATLDQPVAFLRILFEVSVVNAGGYYLLYDTGGPGLPDYLFDEGPSADLTLLVPFQTQQKQVQAPDYLSGGTVQRTVDRVASYTNTLLISSGLSQGALPSAEAPLTPSWKPAFANGSVGFVVQRDDPEPTLTAPAAAAATLSASGGLTRDQVAAALMDAGLDTRSDDFRLAMKEAGDDQSQLSNLFNLMTYGVKADSAFTQSIPGVPVGPTEEPQQDVAGKWLYRQAIPAYRQSASPLPSLDDSYGANPYSGVGQDPQVAYDFLDLFGNPIITDQPLTPLTAKLRYFDPLLGPESWPGVESSYQASAGEGGTGLLSATFAITEDAFISDDGKIDESAVANAMETWFTAGSQMLAPGYQAKLTSTVAPEIESADQTQSLVDFARAAFAFLDALLKGEDPGQAPTVTLQLQLTAQQRDQNQLENIYEAILQLVLRRTDYVDQAAVADLPTIAEVRGAVAPKTDAQASDPRMALTAFAQGFQQAFPELVAATGSGSAGDTTVYAVRMGTLNPGGPGISVSFDSVEPYYYAPPPLSNTLLSRGFDVTFPPFQGKSPALKQTISGIDMDVWGSDFLSAVDVFLLPENAVPAREADADSFNTVMEAKETLAKAIGGAVIPVLADQSPPSDALSDAQRAFRQRLLVTLSSAYEISTVVQPSATVSNSNPTSPPPNLYGPVSGTPNVAAREEKGPGYPLSPSKLAAGQDTSRLESLFSVEVAEDQGNVPLQLGFQITHVESDIQAATEDGYRPSRWLTLILPQQVRPVTDSDVPVALREYPIPPTLASQAGIAEALAACPPPEQQGGQPIQAAKRWQYRFTYSQRNVAQDAVLPDVRFNLGPEVASALRAVSDPDLLDWLALFQRDYPGLQEGLSQHDPDALAYFAYLVNGAAGTWAAWVGDPSARPSRLAAANLAEYRYRYRVDELLETSQIRLTWLPVEGQSLSPVFPWIELTIDEGEPQCLQPSESGLTATYSYQGTDNSDPLVRTLIFPYLDVLDTENGWGGIQLTRNKVLYKENPEITTSDAFIYQTPLVRFVNKKTPLIDISAGLDFDSAITQPQPLRVILGDLFQALFEGADLEAGGSEEAGQRTMQVTTSYSYDVRGGSGPATGPDEDASFLINLPVLSRPPFSFVLGEDWDPNSPDSFVTQMAEAIETWLAQADPSDARAFLLLDVGIFASLSNVQLPVLRLRRLWVGREKIALG
ncbi:MAG TPA: hypothetical protein VLV83_13015, partial [Acidobacteriota bacterium]|nr:hypothetical protein [Acidobacteriota bacterium]